MKSNDSMLHFKQVFEKELLAENIELLEDRLKKFCAWNEHIAQAIDEQNLQYLFRVLKFPFYECLYREIQNRNMKTVCDIVFQYSRHLLFKSFLFAGGDHCSNDALISLACRDYRAVESCLPEEIGISTNGHWLATGRTNLIMAILYPDSPVFADYFAKHFNKLSVRKETGKYKVIFDTLAGIYLQDVEKINDNLEKLCLSTQRVMDIYDEDKLSKCFCLNAHGLYHLAQKALPLEKSRLLKMPLHNSFWKEYAVWQNENPDYVPEFYLQYTEKASFMNKTAATTLPKMKLSGRYKDTETLNREVAELIF